MKLPEWLRLTMLSLAVLVLQQAMLLLRPEWKLGLDLYIIWLLIVSAQRGAGTGAVLALLGGFVMDAPSVSFGLFHTLFYLLPVAVGALFTAHLITEYNLLAGVMSAGLMLLKVLLMFVVALAAGWLPGPGWLFKLNYLPMFFTALLVFVSWKQLVRLVPAERTTWGGLGFGR